MPRDPDQAFIQTLDHTLLLPNHKPTGIAKDVEDKLNYALANTKFTGVNKVKDMDAGMRSRYLAAIRLLLTTWHNALTTNTGNRITRNQLEPPIDLIGDMKAYNFTPESGTYNAMFLAHENGHGDVEAVKKGIEAGSRIYPQLSGVKPPEGQAAEAVTREEQTQAQHSETGRAQEDVQMADVDDERAGAGRTPEVLNPSGPAIMITSPGGTGRATEG